MWLTKTLHISPMQWANKNFKNYSLESFFVVKV